MLVILVIFKIKIKMWANEYSIKITIRVNGGRYLGGIVNKILYLITSVAQW